MFSSVYRENYCKQIMKRIHLIVTVKAGFRSDEVNGSDVRYSHMTPR